MKLRETFRERNPLSYFLDFMFDDIVLEVYNLFNISNFCILEVVRLIGQWSGQSTVLNQRWLSTFIMPNVEKTSQ